MSSKIITEVFLPIIVVLLGLYNVLTSTGGSQISRPAYMGHQWLFHYIVFSEQKTWLEARDVCKSIGGALQYQKFEGVNWYIRTKAERAGWPTSDDIWLGITKDNNSEKWYSVRRNNCREKNFTISGENYSARQCAVLNMSLSSYDDTDNMVYAVSCDAPRTMGFVCMVYKGLIPKGVEFYPMTEVVEKGFKRKKWNSSSEEECAINSFSTFHCYAATYFPEEEHCVAECTQMTTIPETVTLVNSSSNSTVLLRTQNKVSIDHKLTPLTTISDQYPCVHESDTTTTPTDIPTAWSTIDSASTGVTKVTNVTANTPMSYQATTGNTSQCLCICSATAENITTEVLDQKISEIKKTLTVNKTSLSSTVRRKTSAPDSRTSSAGVGAIGICLVVIMISAFVAGDLCYFISFLKSLLK